MTPGAEPRAAELPFVPPGATLTASGRQALSLVAQHLRAAGITELLAPAYHCPTMLEPFQLEGVHVTLVPVVADLLLDPVALAAALAPSRSRASHPSAILHCETFGNRAGPELTAVLAAARAAGHVVVVDETHSFLDGGHAAGDHRVASLRKWLPLPDGAYVTGLPSVELGRRACDDDVTAAGLEALRAEAGVTLGEAAARGERVGPGVNAATAPGVLWERAEVWTDAATAPGVLWERAEVWTDAATAPGALWDRAEALVDAALQPAAMSPESRALLAAIDPKGFVRARAAAAAGLRAALAEAGVQVVNRSACFVAVRVPDADRVARELAAAGIYQPLRWERPRGLSRSISWPAGIITFPPDARCAELVQHGVFGS